MDAVVLVGRTFTELPQNLKKLICGLKDAGAGFHLRQQAHEKPSPMPSMRYTALIICILGTWSGLMLVGGRLHRMERQSMRQGGILERAGRASDGKSRATQDVGHGMSLDLTEIALARCLEGRRVVNFALPDEHTAKVEKWWAGGFGDRLLGMVTALFLAVLTDSGFAVEWRWPYDIHEFFDLRECNISPTMSTSSAPRVSASQVISENEEALAGNTTVLRNTLAQDLWNYFSDGNFAQDNGKNLILWSNARHWQELVRHPSTRTRAQALGINKLSRKELFKLGVESLFRRPSKLLVDSHARLMREFSTRERASVRRKGDSLSRTSGERVSDERSPNFKDTKLLVGVQIRTGGDGDGWSDPLRHPVSSASSCFAAEAASICLTRRACSVFLTADSKRAASLFVRRYTKLVEGYREQQQKTSMKNWASRSERRQPPAIVIQTPGIIAHTDRSTLLEDGDAASQAWLKSVLDWWTLKSADYLLISRSGFGETAAWASSAQVVRRLQLGGGGGLRGIRDGNSSGDISESDQDHDTGPPVHCKFDGAEDAFVW